MSDTRLDVVEERLDQLETEVAALQRNKPGRRAKVLTNLRQPGVCALHEDIDSAECSDANVYRHQQGCRGTGCVIANTEYYAEYRAKAANGA
jgi:hypothetical protein